MRGSRARRMLDNLVRTPCLGREPRVSNTVSKGSIINYLGGWRRWCAKGRMLPDGSLKTLLSPFLRGVLNTLSIKGNVPPLHQAAASCSINNQLHKLHQSSSPTFIPYILLMSYRIPSFPALDPLYIVLLPESNRNPFEIGVIDQVSY